MDEERVNEMTFFTLLSIILFIIILITFIVLKLYTRTRLKSIEGFGGVHKKGQNNKPPIYKSHE